MTSIRPRRALPRTLFAPSLIVATVLIFSSDCLAQGKALPRGTAGRDVVEYYDYGDHWTEGRVYLVEHVDGFTPDVKEIPETRYGGWADRKAEATGFFRVEKVDGRWWFVDPDGGLMHMTGVNYQGGKKPSSREEEWRRDMDFLRNAGFNGLHMSMSRRTGDYGGMNLDMPYCCNLMLTFNYMVYNHSGDARMWDAPPYWDDALREAVEQQAKEQTAAYVDDSYLIGYFTDNEMHWKPDALDVYYGLYVNDEPYEVISSRWDTKGQPYTVRPADYDSYKIVADWVKRNGFEPNEQGEFSHEARRKFQEFQAEQYAKIISEAIRKVDPNHLILSARHVRQDGQCPGLFRGLGKHFDVIGVNYYGAWPPDPVVLDAWEKWSGRPTVISEFSAQSFDTIPRHARDAYIVHAQSDRGKYYQNAVLATLQNPNCVGTLWFCYRDFAAPNEANYGVVDADGKAYDEFVRYCREVNANRYPLIDHLRTQPLDYSDVYDPLRNVRDRERFEDAGD